MDRLQFILKRVCDAVVVADPVCELGPDSHKDPLGYRHIIRRFNLKRFSNDMAPRLGSGEGGGHMIPPETEGSVSSGGDSESR